MSCLTVKWLLLSALPRSHFSRVKNPEFKSQGGKCNAASYISRGLGPTSGRSCGFHYSTERIGVPARVTIVPGDFDRR